MVTFHLQLLQNIGFIPCIIQYIPEPILLSVISTASPTRNLMVFSSLGSVRGKCIYSSWNSVWQSNRKSVIDAHPYQQQGAFFLFYWEAALDEDFLDTDGGDDEHDASWSPAVLSPHYLPDFVSVRWALLLFLRNSDLNLGLSLEASQVAQW